jgi:hypothetical protein
VFLLLCSVVSVGASLWAKRRPATKMLLTGG